MNGIFDPGRKLIKVFGDDSQRRCSKDHVGNHDPVSEGEPQQSHREPYVMDPLHVAESRTERAKLSGLFSGLLLAFPGAFGTLGLRQVTVLNAVIGITVAHGAQRLVVEAGGTSSFSEFFRKLMNGLEMFSGGWNFSLGGLEKLLVALVDKAGDFAANLDTGLGKETGRAIIAALNGGGNARFLEEDTVFCAGSFKNVKAMIAKPIHSFFIRALLCRCRH